MTTPRCDTFDLISAARLANELASSAWREAREAHYFSAASAVRSVEICEAALRRISRMCDEQVATSRSRTLTDAESLAADRLWEYRTEAKRAIEWARRAL